MILILFVLSTSLKMILISKVLWGNTCRDEKIHCMPNTFLNILTLELSKQSDQAMGSNISTAFQANYAIFKNPTIGKKLFKYQSLMNMLEKDQIHFKTN